MNNNVSHVDKRNDFLGIHQHFYHPYNNCFSYVVSRPTRGHSGTRNIFLKGCLSHKHLKTEVLEMQQNIALLRTSVFPLLRVQVATLERIIYL